MVRGAFLHALLTTRAGSSCGHRGKVMKHLIFTVAILGACLFSSQGKADVILEFGQNGVRGVHDFSVIVGQTIDIDLFITQIDGETVLSDEGIIQFGTKFTIDPRTSDPTGAIHQNTEGESTYAFPDAFPNSRDTDLSSNFLVLDSNAGSASEDGVQATGDSIYLGTATIDASSIGNYGISLVREHPLSFATPGLEEFLNPIPASATLTVTAVPEPTACSLVCLIAVGTSLLRRHRLRA